MIYTVEMPTFTVVFLEDGTSYRVLGKECRYRGEEIDCPPVVIACKTCNGNVQKKHQPFHCERHKRCIPNLVYSPEELRDWEERPESNFYKLCTTCLDKTCLSPVVD